MLLTIAEGMVPTQDRAYNMQWDGEEPDRCQKLNMTYLAPWCFQHFPVLWNNLSQEVFPVAALPCDVLRTSLRIEQEGTSDT
ncbi:hypothetical protein TNIN_173811 [Trichonephila inaurata madagascariensis]|uniref:Uncharacterized protein n=1 Tax=Trichonephila inaurata madagascariensis TaxID=2747483 RepID=A0A8X6JWS6_9ARAC|nr:hypothetical protein TNIN_173811 [Trichonephila inaurata madagascariensis]